MIRFLVAVLTVFAACCVGQTPPTGKEQGGLLFFASYRERDNTDVIANPHIAGALFTIYWSEIEPREGQFTWSEIDRRIAPWLSADKKVALRIMWSSSGSWPDPAARHPTPQWVFDHGAAKIMTRSAPTEIPLAWDPIYQKYAGMFLRECARKFDGHPGILFIDVTPGAETNPYRFRRINVAEPEFKQRFLEAQASDGRRYSDHLWLDTVKQQVNAATEAFTKTPLLVTLNQASLDGPSQMREVGEYCVSKGCYIGQNGLRGSSYTGPGGQGSLLKTLGQRTGLYLEMLDASGPSTGTLMEVMQAAERAGCDFLGVYASDVLKGTPAQRQYEAAYEEALRWGAQHIGK